MKTINFSKLTFILLVTAGLFSFSFTSEATGNFKTGQVMIEETEEPELAIEPWMTSPECFEQLISKLNNESYDCVLFEESEEPLPIEGWMTDLAFPEKIQSKYNAVNSFDYVEISQKLL